MNFNFKKPDFKIKTTTMQRVGKIILWVLVVFLLLRGIGSIFREDTAAQAEKMISAFKTDQQKREELNFRASSFAQNFVMDYLTYDSLNSEDYITRLKSYVPSYMDSLGTSLSGKSKALYASAVNIEWISEDQANVDVLANVRYKVQETGANGENIETETEKDTCIRVPIAIKNNSFAVEDYPVFIAKPAKASINFNVLSGTQIDNSQTGEIGLMLENFFRVYYQGNSGEISYYLLDSNKSISGLNGRYKFDRIDSTRVLINKKEKNGYLALVELSVYDINNQAIKQRFNLDLIKKDGRYYIKNLDTRTVNLDKIKDLGEENK